MYDLGVYTMSIHRIENRGKKSGRLRARIQAGSRSQMSNRVHRAVVDDEFHSGRVIYPQVVSCRMAPCLCPLDVRIQLARSRI